MTTTPPAAEQPETDLDHTDPVHISVPLAEVLDQLAATQTPATNDTPQERP